MFDFRNFMHKISAIGIATAIPCDEAIQFTGNQGIFIFDINIGTELGNVNLNHEAFGVPDRFQIEYDGVIVADSLYVGDSLTGNPPDLGGGFVGNTYNNVPEFFWDGTQFVANGNTQNLTIQQSDVAPFGQTDGMGTIFFQKITSNPAVMTVRVFAPLGGTAWNMDTECPDLVGIGCSEDLSFSADDQAGTYYTNVELGLDTGLVTVDYNAGNIPDRFQIMYDGVIVADSLFVGGYFTGNPPDADTALWEGGGGSGMFVGKTYNNIPDYEWDGAAFVATGPTTNHTVMQADVAPFGQTAGAGTLSFVKPNALPSSMTIIVTSLPANTGWSFDPNCPVPIPDSILLSSTSVSPTWQAQSVIKTGGALTWDVTGGITDNQVGDNPIFDFTLNAGTADVTVTPSTDITTFNVPSLDITTIDVSNAPNLDTFICAINNLSILDVTTNTLLDTFDCSSNNLNVLDVTQNVLLTLLGTGNNNLSALDVTQNTILAILGCEDNNLNTIDLTQNTALIVFNANNNNFATLNLTQNTVIEEVRISGNSIPTIDLTQNTALRILVMSNNGTTSFDLSQNLLLESFTASVNSLNAIDVTLNTALQTLNVLSNSISTIDISNNTALVNLAVQDNSLTNLDITNNTLLTNVSCDGNVLVAVDIDNIIIQLDTNGLSNGMLEIPLGRTAASDAARTSLLGKGWTVTEI